MPLVVFDLLLPIFRIFFWYMLLTFVAVPETAVYEKGDLFLEEDEIRMTFDVVIATPTCDAIFLENLDELEFR